jgi:hypothetical protein
MPRHISTVLFMFALVLCSLALSESRIDSPSPKAYVALGTAYLLQWVALVAEMWSMAIGKRPNRIRAYIMLLFGNSFLPAWEGARAIQVPFHGLLPVLWGVFSWISFAPVLYFAVKSDRDLPLNVRLTPFGFSLLGALVHWVWALSF